jgi:hypothetical protein
MIRTLKECRLSGESRCAAPFGAGILSAFCPVVTPQANLRGAFSAGGEAVFRRAFSARF